MDLPTIYLSCCPLEQRWTLKTKFNDLVFECCGHLHISSCFFCFQFANTSMLAARLDHGERVSLLPKAGVAVDTPDNVIEEQIVFTLSVTMSPREIMKAMFKLQGLFVDPSSLEDVLVKIVAAVGSGYGNGINKYDCYVSYRMHSDQLLAQELYFRLKDCGIRAFWDKECMKVGERWKDGFLNGKLVL